MAPSHAHLTPNTTFVPYQANGTGLIKPPPHLTPTPTINQPLHQTPLTWLNLLESFCFDSLALRALASASAAAPTAFFLASFFFF